MAKVGTGVIGTLVVAVVFLVILFNVYADVVPEAQDAAMNFNSTNQCEVKGCYWNTTNTTAPCMNTSVGSGVACQVDYEIPLDSLFNPSGAVFVLIMAAALIMVVRGYLKNN